MAAGPRMELVGKRFVCVGDSGCELDVSRIHEWEWRSGVIRAVSYREPSNSELSAYVEFDDLEWEKREWVKVYEDFQIFLVEHQLVWAKRKNPCQSQGSKNKQIQWPALEREKETTPLSTSMAQVEKVGGFEFFGVNRGPRTSMLICQSGKDTNASAL